jgi:Pentapeptide repeats (8 copies)
MKIYTQEELKEILELHKKWLEGEEDGVRANLKGAYLVDADLKYANLKGAYLVDADLRYANLRGAYLVGANLEYAYLVGANLEYANLGGANLEYANLRGANLFNTTGEKKYVKSLQLETYSIVYTSSILQIGCKKFTFQEWRDFDDETISKMDNGALEFWKKWKETIFKLIEMSPALHTKDKKWKATNTIY